MEVFVDLESQSLVDLKQEGARRYICHPSTRLMMLVAKYKGQIYPWLPQAPISMASALMDKYPHIAMGQLPWWLREWEDEGYTFIGHNCYNFDAPFLEHHYGLHPRWYDTMHPARASGLPGGLDAIGQALGSEGKDEEGKKVMRLLCQAKVKGGEVVYPGGTPALWSKLLTYNIRDVELTEQLYNEVKGAEEPAVVEVDRVINNRGVRVDTQWLRDLLALWDELERQGGDRLARLTGGTLTRENAASVPQVRKWLELQGVRVQSLNRKALEALYEDPEAVLGECDDAAKIVEVLKLRQSMTRAMKGKLQRIAETVEDDGRVRDWSVYYGAHTGRFTSRRIQLHNMARGASIDAEAVINGPRTLEHVKSIAGIHDVDDVLASLVRPVFCASEGHCLGIVDYNAVEARGVAWLAGEQWLLDAFNDPKRDVYCEFGSRIFGRTITKADKTERGIAKICVLGMGYGMSHRKFQLYAEQAGIDLSAHGLTAEGLVKQYRESCPAIVAMWREVGAQAEVARRHGHGLCCMGRVGFHSHGSPHLYCTLPSGRVLTYRNCRFERRVPAYCAALGLPPFEKDTLVYRTARRYDAGLYGSKLVENIVQAFCRDFLTDALVKLQFGQGTFELEPVLHVHDEVVCEIPKQWEERGLHHMCRIMSTPPEWARGFPLRVEGFTVPRYVKSPWKNSVKCDYLNGRSV